MTKFDKIIKISEQLGNVHDILFLKFFDISSKKMLDEKLEVVSALAEGKKPSEIKNYYKVLELMPKAGENEDIVWDL